MSEQKTVGGHFQIISALSSGGFGQTFLAEDLRLPDKPKCVVKQLKPQSNDPKIIELAGRLFEQEVIALYNLGKHPQIPTLITHFEENTEFYFVQEYIEGNTFERELQLGKVYNQAKVIEITSQLLDVLSFVHKQNVIHRDIKPANLINRISDEKIVLIDFGAVKQVTNQTAIYPHQTPQNTIAIGSDGFMPSEQLAGQPKFSSDVYAVGMFAVQLLTQTHPTQLRQNQRTGEWIWQDKTNVNPRFAEVINQMIRYDFRQRFANAVEANNALKSLNLNGQSQPHEVWKEKTYIPQNFQNRPTQATHFRPNSVNENLNNPPQNVHNQNLPQKRQHFQEFNQPVQYRQNTLPLKPQKSLLEQYGGNKPSQMLPPVTEENISMGNLAEGWGDSLVFKLLMLAVLIILLLLGAYSFIRLSLEGNTVAEVKASQEITSTTPFEVMIKKDEQKAVTSEDWLRISRSWESLSEDLEMEQFRAITPAAKASVKNRQAEFLNHKLNALRKSDALRK
jgi:serine/threonine protein kinase